MSTYLEFADKSDPAKKTKRIAVFATRDGAVLGQIRWFGRWRQYAFFPADGCVFNRECMADISGEIDKLMRERRAVGSAR